LAGLIPHFAKREGLLSGNWDGYSKIAKILKMAHAHARSLPPRKFVFGGDQLQDDCDDGEREEMSFSEESSEHHDEGSVYVPSGDEDIACEESSESSDEGSAYVPSGDEDSVQDMDIESDGDGESDEDGAEDVFEPAEGPGAFLPVTRWRSNGQLTGIHARRVSDLIFLAQNSRYVEWEGRRGVSASSASRYLFDMITHVVSQWGWGGESVQTGMDFIEHFKKEAKLVSAYGASPTTFVVHKDGKKGTCFQCKLPRNLTVLVRECEYDDYGNLDLLAGEAMWLGRCCWNRLDAIRKAILLLGEIAFTSNYNADTVPCDKFLALRENIAQVHVGVNRRRRN
jgi:hypothetical protein